MRTLKHLGRLTGIAIVSIAAASSSVDDCTSFLLQAADGTPVYGCTLKYGIDTPQSVIVAPRKYVCNHLTSP